MIGNSSIFFIASFIPTHEKWGKDVGEKSIFAKIFGKLELV